MVYAMDLGDVTSGKVFPSMPQAKLKAGSPVFINVDQAQRSTSGASPCKNRDTKEYAGMMELADMQDLGDVTSGKVFT